MRSGLSSGFEPAVLGEKKPSRFAVVKKAGICCLLEAADQPAASCATRQRAVRPAGGLRTMTALVLPASLGDWLLELGLIDRDAALRVAQDAERDLAGTSPLASKWLDLQYDAERLRGT